MPELIKGFDPSDKPKRGARVSIDRTDAEYLGTGLSEGTVHKVQVEVAGPNDRARTISMAEKTFDHPSHTDEERQALIAHVLGIHRELLERDLPTIPTMRTEKGNKNIMMTDLTENGKNEVVSMPDWVVGPGRKGKHADTEYKVEIANVEEVAEHLLRIFEQSVATGCRLGDADIFFLVINKDTKKAKVLLGDVWDIKFVDPTNVDVKRDLIASNYESIRLFVKEIRDHINSTEKFTWNPVSKKKLELMNELEELSSIAE